MMLKPIHYMLLRIFKTHVAWYFVFFDTQLTFNWTLVRVRRCIYNSNWEFIHLLIIYKIKSWYIVTCVNKFIDNMIFYTFRYNTDANSSSRMLVKSTQPRIWSKYPGMIYCLYYFKLMFIISGIVYIINICKTMMEKMIKESSQFRGT